MELRVLDLETRNQNIPTVDDLQASSHRPMAQPTSHESAGGGIGCDEKKLVRDPTGMNCIPFSEDDGNT